MKQARKKQLYRVARANSFGVIDARSSVMTKAQAEKSAAANNKAAEASGDSYRYLAVADSPWDIDEIGSGLAQDAQAKRGNK